MINIVVRSSRDADAVKSMIKKFYPEWEIKVYTLHGSREIDDVKYYLDKIISNDQFYVLMLGKEDKDLVNELVRNKPVNLAIVLVPRRKVRNTRIEHLAWLFDIGRSMFRLGVGWDRERNAYILDPYRGIKLEDYRYDPGYDVFIGLGDNTRRYLEEIISGKICSDPLMLRVYNGIHNVYCGDKIVAKISIPDEGIKPTGTYILKNNSFPQHILSETIRANKEIMNIYERIAIETLKKYREWADTVIVPWSGGKDSTASLLLTLRVFRRDKIVAVYADTGTEFPWTREYVEEISEKLGINTVRVYAGVDKGLLVENMPLPTHDNRWCTLRKINAIEKVIHEYMDKGNVLIVKGDRDAESRSRSIRPPISTDSENRIVVTPIKFWGTIHVQLYLLSKGISLNSLYYKGFYRIGCYMCPALRSWELYIMLKDPEIRKVLEKYSIFKMFIKKRIGEKPSG
jgi:3'-phosphoadenosine 5'-phosphosulfate sulfotransferase (PAPS reductase)/FAD synthetase/3'-phosphoadenosine 5'-phosphosulfate sulfotransferase